MQPKLSITLATLAIGLTAPAISAQEAREFRVTQHHIAAVRETAKQGFARYYATDDAIGNSLDRSCQAARDDGSLEPYTDLRLRGLRQLSRAKQSQAIDYYTTVDVVALSLVCPQYHYMLNQ